MIIRNDNCYSHKTRKNKFSRLALLLIAVLFIVSCSGGDSQNDLSADISSTEPTSSQAEAADLVIAKDGTTEFMFYQPESNGVAVVDALYALQDLMEEKTGIKKVYFESDWVKGEDVVTNNSFEVLVGETNRIESINALKELDPGDFTVKAVGNKLVILGGTHEATVKAIEYFSENFVTGKDITVEAEYAYTYIAPPQITAHSFESNYCFENNSTPSFTVEFKGETNLDTQKCNVSINDTDVSSKLNWAEESVSFTSDSLEPGEYTLNVKLTDTFGNTSESSRPFVVSDGSIMNLYCGELHSHTANSDGTGTLEDAYTYARDTGKVDFFSVTDHSHYFNNATYTNKHIGNADDFNDPGKFAALFGYELTWNYSTGFWGHINVLNGEKLYERSSITLPEYYATALLEPNAIGMFNHPGYKWGNFAEYEYYSEEADQLMDLMEVKGSSYDIEYMLALAKGWHISPIYNEDNHSPNWTTSKEAVGYVLSPSLTRENIVESIKKNRTYTTTDPNLKIYYKVNDEWMGSRLDNPSELKVSVDVSTTTEGGIGKVYLMAEDNIIVASYDATGLAEYKWELTLSAQYDYYYVKVTNDNTYAITGPVWIENRNIMEITDLDASLITYGDKPYGVNVTVKNLLNEEITDVKVDFYATDVKGFDITSATPVETFSLPAIAANAEISVDGYVPYSFSKRRITVVVTAAYKGETYTETLFIRLEQIYITEVMPATKNSSGVESPYEYIELYNNSNEPIVLDGYKIRIWPKAGAGTDDFTENTYTVLSGTIQPRSTFVVWFKHSASNKKTVDDFNAYYGSDLTEGENLFISTGVALPDKNSIQIDILNENAKEIMRIWYNWGDAKNDIITDKAMTYKYCDAYTDTAVRITNEAEPTPGTVDPECVPTVR